MSEMLFANAVVLALVLVAIVAYAAVMTRAWWSERRQGRRCVTALNYMTQGLCMIDAQMRLIVCNKRYIEMYGMSPAVVKPGVSLRKILEHRTAMGQFSGNIDEYLREIEDRAGRREGKKR